MSTKAILSFVGAACWAFSGDLSAAPGYYQVTGQIVEVSDTMTVVQKGEEKWHLFRDAAASATANLKVGAKVTVDYKMMATSVDVKEMAASEAPKKK
jgi:hypothetical protein